MKKTIKKEVLFCDVCKKEMDYCTNRCLICGKEVCYDCAKEHVTTFHHAVHFSGSSDGRYCIECLSKPIPTEHIPLLNAYRNIVALRNESEAWSKDFEARGESAEATIKKLQEKDK